MTSVMLAGCGSNTTTEDTQAEDAAEETTEETDTSSQDETEGTGQTAVDEETAKEAIDEEEAEAAGFTDGTDTEEEDADEETQRALPLIPANL